MRGFSFTHSQVSHTDRFCIDVFLLSFTLLRRKILLQRITCWFLDSLPHRNGCWIHARAKHNVVMCLHLHSAYASGKPMHLATHTQLHEHSMVQKKWESMYFALTTELGRHCISSHSSLFSSWYWGGFHEHRLFQLHGFRISSRTQLLIGVWLESELQPQKANMRCLLKSHQCWQQKEQGRLSAQSPRGSQLHRKGCHSNKDDANMTIDRLLLRTPAYAAGWCLIGSTTPLKSFCGQVSVSTDVAHNQNHSEHFQALSYENTTGVYPCTQNKENQTEHYLTMRAIFAHKLMIGMCEVNYLRLSNEKEQILFCQQRFVNKNDVGNAVGLRQICSGGLAVKL